MNIFVNFHLISDNRQWNLPMMGITSVTRPVKFLNCRETNLCGVFLLPYSD